MYLENLSPPDNSLFQFSGPNVDYAIPSLTPSTVEYETFAFFDQFRRLSPKRYKMVTIDHK